MSAKAPSAKAPSAKAPSAKAPYTRHLPVTWVQTAESVTAGHADKICDQIADDILDAILREDRYARVACEVMATSGMVIVTGQITTKCWLDITGLVRGTL